MYGLFFKKTNVYRKKIEKKAIKGYFAPFMGDSCGYGKI